MEGPGTSTVVQEVAEAITIATGMGAAAATVGASMAPLFAHLQFLQMASLLCPAPNARVDNVVSLGEWLEWTDFKVNVPWASENPPVETGGGNSTQCRTEHDTFGAVRIRWEFVAHLQRIVLIAGATILLHSMLYARHRLWLGVSSSVDFMHLSGVTLFPKAELFIFRMLSTGICRRSGMFTGTLVPEGIAGGVVVQMLMCTFTIGVWATVVAPGAAKLAELVPTCPNTGSKHAIVYHPDDGSPTQAFDRAMARRHRQAELRWEPNTWIERDMSRSNAYVRRYGSLLAGLKSECLQHMCVDIGVRNMMIPFCIGLFANTCFCKGADDVGVTCVQHSLLLGLLLTLLVTGLHSNPYYGRVRCVVEVLSTVLEMAIIGTSLARSTGTGFDPVGQVMLVLAGLLCAVQVAEAGLTAWSTFIITREVYHTRWSGNLGAVCLSTRVLSTLRDIMDMRDATADSSLVELQIEPVLEMQTVNPAFVYDEGVLFTTECKATAMDTPCVQHGVGLQQGVLNRTTVPVTVTEHHRGQPQVAGWDVQVQVPTRRRLYTLVDTFIAAVRPQYAGDADDQQAFSSVLQTVRGDLRHTEDPLAHGALEGGLADTPGWMDHRNRIVNAARARFVRVALMATAAQRMKPGVAEPLETRP